MPKIIDQVIASTAKDSQGEMFSKEDLKKILDGLPSKMPLNQRHDQTLKPIGSIDNFRLVPDGETWNIIADIESDQDLPEWGKGFSFSAIRTVTKREGSVLTLALPYPIYNRQDIVDALASDVPKANVARHLQKAADPATIALIVSGLFFIFGPAWKELYDQKIAPQLPRAVHALKGALRSAGINAPRIEYQQTMKFDCTGENITLLFLSVDTLNCKITFEKAVGDALEASEKVLRDDLASSGVLPRKLVLKYVPERAEYAPKYLIRQDDTVHSFE